MNLLRNEMNSHEGALVRHRIYGDHIVILDDLLHNYLVLEHRITKARRQISRTGWLNDWAVVEEEKKQVGGTHYTDLVIQPWEVIRANKMGFFDGNALKYLMRYEGKNGVQDLKKAIHYIEELIKDLENE